MKNIKVYKLKSFPNNTTPNILIYKWKSYFNSLLSNFILAIKAGIKNYNGKKNVGIHAIISFEYPNLIKFTEYVAFIIPKPNLYVR
jgi:hypothetical protein